MSWLSQHSFNLKHLLFPPLFVSCTQAEVDLSIYLFYFFIQSYSLHYSFWMRLHTLPLCQSAKWGVSTKRSAAWDLPGHLAFVASSSFGSFGFSVRTAPKKDTGSLIVLIKKTEFERNSCLQFMMFQNKMHKPDCTFQWLKEKHDSQFRGQRFTSVLQEGPSVNNEKRTENSWRKIKFNNEAYG